LRRRARSRAVAGQSRRAVVVYMDFLLIFLNLPEITGKFSPFTENLLLPVNEILYRTIITTPDSLAGQSRRAVSPGRLAGQSSRAVSLGSLAGQSRRAVWPGSLAGQSRRAVAEMRLFGNFHPTVKLPFIIVRGSNPSSLPTIA
jgi:hypothetical protein